MEKHSEGDSYFHFRSGLILFFLFLLIAIFSPSLTLCDTNFPDSFYALVLEKLERVSSPAYSNNKASANADCKIKYSDLYDKGTLRVAFFFGAIDTPHNIYIDPYLKRAFVEYLSRDCRPNIFACGFFKINDEPALLEKSTLSSKKVVITIYDSSVDAFLKQHNDLEPSFEQYQKSANVTEAFLRSLKENDIVFYLGHSRYGTGPGFHHLPFLSEQWLSNYLGSPLQSAIVRSLKESPAQPKILGIFGCSTQRFYARELHAVAPHMGLIVSDVMTIHEENAVEALTFLNLLLGEICPPEFNKEIKELNSKHKLYGFFEKNKFPSFTADISIQSIALFTLLLPMIVAFSTFFPRYNYCFFEIKQSVCKGFVLMALALTSCLLTIKCASIIFKEIDRQSIPLFFLLVGLCLLAALLYSKEINLKASWSALACLTAPLLLSALIYFFINFYPEKGYDQLVFSLIQSIKFLLLSTIIFPFSFITTDIFYSLLTRLNKSRLFRFISFFTASELFSLAIAISVSIINPYIATYISIIFVTMFYTQLISLLIYLWKPSLLIPSILQSLTLAIIFAENIHGLFY